MAPRVSRKHKLRSREGDPAGAKDPAALEGPKVAKAPNFGKVAALWTLKSEVCGHSSSPESVNAVLEVGRNSYRELLNPPEGQT